MKWSLQFSEHALNDLESLDKVRASQVLTKLEMYGSTENPLQFAKRLSGRLNGYFRFRIGNYRAVCKIERRNSRSILYILRVKHRRDVYE